MEAARRLNDRLRHWPGKLALTALTLALVSLALLLLPYVWPVAFAFVLSRLLEPFVRFASKGFLSRRTAALLGIGLLVCLCGLLVTLLASRLAQALSTLAQNLPRMLAWLNDAVLPRLSALPLPKEAASALGENTVRWAASLSGWITGGAWSTAASLPHMFLCVALILSAAYSFLTDRESLIRFWRRALPEALIRRVQLVHQRLSQALLVHIRGQLLLSLAVMFFLMLTLGLSGIRHGVMIGMGIGLADALPVLGAGLFLLPWSAVCFLTGQLSRGVTLLCLYAGTLLLRQILEPRLVSRSLGLYPPAAMAAMYAGFRLMGFAGLLAGPLLMHLVKAVLDTAALSENRPPAPPPRRCEHSGASRHPRSPRP